ncbi:unnamed protein product, partial [Mesorhabditis spiculigera]
MPHYKLTYFDIRGRGEPARQLFALAHVDFEDQKIKKENWAVLKPTTPFGTLPILEVDGKELGQSKTIYRYLGKQFDFAGADDWESAQIDQWVDQLQDYDTAMRPWSAVSWADLMFVNALEITLTSAPNFLDKYPEIIAYVKKIHEIPEIKERNEKQGLNY